MSDQTQGGIENGELKEQDRILREVLERERLQSDEDLARALARYSQAYFGPQEGIRDSANLEAIYDEMRRIRVYVISELVNWLYGHNQPNSLIEIGSAGDITAAMALPQTQITSLDADPDIFLNLPNNSLPGEVFTSLGMKKSIEGYGKDNIWRSKKSKLAFVEKCLPNWRESIADARRIPFHDGSFDIALVQGPLEIGDFMGEMARVIKLGGHLVTILDEDLKEVGSPSAYETNRYNGYPRIPMIDSQQANSLGLRKLDVPDKFRRYENLATLRDKDGALKAAGIVFQVFKKS